MPQIPLSLDSSSAGPIPRKWHDGGETSRRPRFITAFQGADDENFIDRTITISRFTGVAAGYFSLADIVLMPHKGGIPTALTRIKWWSIPFIGGGIAYTATVNLVSGLRKKTDQTNHFIGGLAVGAVLGKHVKSVQLGVVMGLGIGLLGMAFKDSVINGYEIWPIIPRAKQIGNAFHYKYDYTPRDNRTGYWVRSEEEIPEVQARGPIYTRIAEKIN